MSPSVSRCCLSAQEANTVVPNVVDYSGTLLDGNGKPLAGTVGVTFMIYKGEQGGAPLWIETQNLTPDKSGHYTVALGSTTRGGLPANLFASGEARWLAVQPQGQDEQSRVLLVAVPYAMKAQDAETIGGLPPSAFMLAVPGSSNSQSAPPSGGSGGTNNGAPPLAGSGTKNYIPLWTDSSGDLGDSILFQSGTTSVGIGTTTPAATLDVNGGVISRGALQLPSTGTATSSQGFDSQPFTLQGSAYNSSTNKAIGPLFQWQTEPAGNDTSTPSGTLNLLYGTALGSASETGLNIAKNGQITFATGQKFPGTGTITAVTAGQGLSGGGSSGNVTLSINTTFANEFYPQLAAANTFTKSQTINGNLSLTGTGNGVIFPDGTKQTTAATGGGGTITGVTAGTDLTGGGTSGNVTLNLDTTKVPQLASANTFTNNQTINGSVTASSFSGSGAGLTNVTAANSNELGGLAPSAFAELGASSNTFSGPVTASSFSGNGASVTNVNAATLGGVASNAFSQLGLSNTYQSSPLGTAIPQVLAPVNAASTSTGFNSNPFDFAASSFNSSANAAQKQTFRWQAEPVGNDTTTPSGKLNLLFGANGATPTETGLSIANNGIITFASGQTFGTGGGTITGVTAGTDLTGGGTNGNVTLNVDTTKVPQLASANSFTASQSVSGNLTASGVITGGTGVFSANNSTQVVNITQNGSGTALAATSGTGAAVSGSGGSIGILGVGPVGVEGTSNAGDGVYGTSTSGSGVLGTSSSGLGVSASSSSYTALEAATGSVTNPAIEGVAYASTSGATAAGVWGYSATQLGFGVHGQWSSPSVIGNDFSDTGVWGDSSAGIGVFGSSDGNPGVYGLSTYNFGVSGDSVNYIGIYGGGAVAGLEGVGVTNSFSGEGFNDVGAWGDSGEYGSIGVLGTTDNGNSLFGKNNTVNHETLYAENDSGFNDGTPIAARFAGPGSSTYCYFPRDFNDNGTGDLVCTGSKSAAVPVQGNRMVRLYAVEAADNWFEDAGSGQLASGSATIALDQVFAQTVNGDVDYHVFITPNGDCEGLYVANKTANGFEVHELHGGHSNVAFDYRIMARRKGFEKVRMQDVTADFVQMKRESDALATRLEAGKAKAKTRPKPHVTSLGKRLPTSAANVAPSPWSMGQRLTERK